MTRMWQTAGCFGGILVACAMVGCDSQELPTTTSAENPAGLNATSDSASEESVAAREDVRATDDPKALDSADSQPRTATASAEARTDSVPAAKSPLAESPNPAGRTPAIRVPSRSVGGVQEVTFDTIKLPLEKDQPFTREVLTPDVIELDGQEIRIRGYILPTSVFRQTGITQFVLVRDNQQCCFGPGAALHDCIVVEMKSGRAADYTIRPVSVEGKFTLAEMINPDDGRHLAIYHLDGEKVQ